MHVIQIPSAAPSFMGFWSDLKSSEDMLLYLYVIWNTLKSADLHETILTPVICHSRWRDAVFLHEVSIGRPKEDEKWTFLDISADFRAF